MNHLNDEILNKYIDNELTGKELSEINDHIKICDKCLIILKAHRLADQHLKRMDAYSPSADFTERIMKKVQLATKPLKPKKSYFFRFIFSFMLLLCLGVVIAAFANISGSTSEGVSVNEYILKEVTQLFSGYKHMVTGRSASIIGTVLSFIILVSAYFIYESHKSFKSHLDKLG